MVITICGSMSFAREMLEMQQQLQNLGHTALVPEGTELYLMGGRTAQRTDAESAACKVDNDLIRKHYELIEQSDAIVVINKKKGEIENYLGGNAFLEIGFAHILRKKIFLTNSVPNIPLFKSEIEAMQPVVLHGDCTKII